MEVLLQLKGLSAEEFGSECWKVLRHHERIIKGNSGECSEGRRRARERTSGFLENILLSKNNILGEMYTLKANLMTSQTEMRNILLATGGKVTAVFNVTKRLNCSPPLVFCAR